MSYQFNYNELDWINLSNKLKNKYKIVTTKKIDNILCTLDDNLSIKDIAALSTKVKILIAINTGVIPGCLNVYTINNLKKAYIFDIYCKYSYLNFENKNSPNDIDINEIDKLLNIETFQQTNNIINNVIDNNIYKSKTLILYPYNNITKKAM